MKKHLHHVALSSAFGVLALVTLLACDNDFKELYQLEELRVPVLQVLQESANTTDPHCRQLVDGKTYCQQFPLRPNVKTQLRFVAIAPAGTAPVNLEITKLTRQVLGNDLAAAASGRGGFEDAPADLTSLGVVKNTTLSRVVQTEGMYVEEIVFDLTAPTVDTYVSDFLSNRALPNYTLTYEANRDGQKDKGYFSFYVLPDPADTASWDKLSQNVPRAANALIERFKSQSATNIPPTIVSVTPATGTKIGDDTDLEAKHLGDDTDPDAKIRFQWFVTSGDVKLQSSRKTEWENIKSSGKHGAFVVVRDLQGGVDFSYTTLEKD